MILVIDNNIDLPHGSADIVRYLSGAPVTVVRGPDSKLPADLSGVSRVVISGSKTSCLAGEPWIDPLLKLIREAAEKSIPTLGICFGHQMMARAYGGVAAVRRSTTPEFGWVEITNTAAADVGDPVLGGLPARFVTFASHFEEVAVVPPGFRVTASSQRCGVQAYQMQGKPMYGIQFHPERNAAEGQESIDQRKAHVSSDCIFNDGKSCECYTPNVPEKIFRAFLELKA